jgi:hypothetical protein
MSRSDAPNAAANIDPLVVTPATARKLLGISNTHLYKILGELESYRDGRARRITMASIKARIARRIADGAARAEPPRRRRGRPPKHPQPEVAA